MPAPAIKICGISAAPTLEATIAARAEYVGFNFFAASPRFVALDQAAVLGRRAAGRIVKVGVFVDAGDDQIAAASEAAGLDILQLHGSESPERCAQLAAQLGRKVWKVLSIASRADLARAASYAGAAQFLLLDAKTPTGSLPGGMGLAFDWSLLSGWKAPLPWGLAGGLSPANVAQAARLTGAGLVDTSSGVETAPGIKDEALIAAFCAAARAR